MDDSWRYHQHQHHHHHPNLNLCPVCSAPHFPFCPPPPPSPHQHHHLPRFPAHHQPPPLPPPSDPYLLPFRHPPPPSEPFHYSSNDFLDRDGSSPYKRLRLDEHPPLPHHTRLEPPAGGGFLSEDHWRPNLARDHGWRVGFPPNPVPPQQRQQLDVGYQRDSFYGGGSSLVGSNGGSENWNGAALPREQASGHQNRILHRNGYEECSDGSAARQVVGGYRSDSYQRTDFEGRDVEYLSGSDMRPSFSGHMMGDYQHGDLKRSSGIYAGQVSEERFRPVVHPSANYGLQGQPERYDYNGRESVQQPKVVGQYSETSSGLPSGNVYPAYSQPLDNKYELPNQNSGLKRNHSEVISYDPTAPYDLEASGKGDISRGSYAPFHDGRNTNNITRTENWSRGSEVYPPRPSVHVPEGHPEAPQPHFQVSNLSPIAPKTLFPVLPSSSSVASFPPSAHVAPKPYTLPHSYREPPVYSSSEVVSEGLPFSHHTPAKLYPEERSPKVAISHPLQMPTVVDAYNLFKLPYRASRPDHIVIILRGLPGSGKTYLAKSLRDLEVENGGNAPRIHAMDDYFMVEVEKKVEENEGSKPSSSSRLKRQMTKKVIEYCYEPEMEEAYRSSMLKAFTKTLDEGIFTFIIVDDRNLRVADFAQFWAIAKRSGYEVYLLEAPYKDPTGCAARNVHGFTFDEVQRMSEQWEEAPSMYLRLDTQSLFRGDDLKVDSIQEVDMDTNDDDAPGLHNKEIPRQDETTSVDNKSDRVGERWDSEEEEEEDEKENDTSKVKDIGSSKWSKDLDEEIESKQSNKQNVNALSGLIQSYSKKSVHWGDQAAKNGFSIGALKKLASSLIIGPGSGYNFMSNPTVDDMDEGLEAGSNSYAKKRFNDQLRAERESFRAVFDKRKQRIGGFNNAEDD